MAIIRLKDLKGMNSEELETKRSEIEAELSRERGSVAAGTKAENPGRIREMRKTIARIETIKRERGLRLQFDKKQPGGDRETHA
ncbi:50S ribosomal protein L29 [Candidatus Micrarchaeota archaeon]|nr:50S ribosomal protein L29 [Candidatus Micrarchaeota archaeon]